MVQPVPVQPVPGAASANAWGSQRLPGAATTCLGQPMPASRQQAAPLQSIAFAIHILAKGEAGNVRIQQLRQTLGQNLGDNEADQDKVGFSIVSPLRDEFTNQQLLPRVSPLSDEFTHQQLLPSVLPLSDER